MKSCTRCKVEKPLSEFHKQGFKKGGSPRFTSACKACRNAIAQGKVIAPVFTPLVPAAKPEIVNHFAVVLDASGSMASIQDAARKAFNAQIDVIREAGKAEGHKNTVTVAIFGKTQHRTDGWITDFPRVGQSAERVQGLAPHEYTPSGMTPLFRAVNDTIDKLRTLPGGRDTSYVLMVVTDGNENASGLLALDVLHKNMRELEATKRWTLTFAVPRGSGAIFASSYGLPEGNVTEWEATEAGVRELEKVYRGSTMSFSTARTSGETYSTSYFTPDLSKLKVADVKKLDDVSDRVKTWKVNHEQSIRDFVESHKMPYILGGGYYQLMKKERVQANKGVIIREKGKKALYAGKQARDLLGLPDKDVTVIPGNFSNYDIFIQSASTNRILVRGTEFCYDTKARPGIRPTWEDPAQLGGVA